VDRLVRDPGSDVAFSHSEAAEALAAARQMAQLPALLGPVDPAFEERVMRRVRGAGRLPHRTPWLRLGWAVGGLALVLLAVLLFTSLGDTAVAGLMAVFDLGRTDLRVAPEEVSPAVPETAVEGGRAVRQTLTLAEAQASVAFTIPQPGYLPPGFRLAAVYGYQYPDLPAWVPQPFFVELIYHDSEGEELLLRVYSIALGDEASVSSLNLRAPPIEDAQDVEVNGQPGVLLRQYLEPSGIELLELVWEQDDLILALSSHHLGQQDLLDIAHSIQGSNP
jgi:hypothetical protein